MPNPTPLHLRRAIVQAADRGESHRSIAARFNVTTKTVYNLLRLRAKQGTLEDSASTGHRQRRFVGEDETQLLELARANPDATQEELAEMAARHLGIRANRRTVGRVLARQRGKRLFG